MRGGAGNRAARETAAPRFNILKDGGLAASPLWWCSIAGLDGLRKPLLSRHPGLRRDDGEGLGCSGLLEVTLRNGSGDMSLLLSMYRPRWSLESVAVFAAWLCVFGSKESAVWVMAVGAWL